jgi:hypothetical protein
MHDVWNFVGETCQVNKKNVFNGQSYNFELQLYRIVNLFKIMNW